MSDPVFRQLSADEFDSGYEIYLTAFDWLKAKGIRQWLVPLARPIYETRHQRGENYGLFVDGHLAVTLSLSCGTPREWADVVSKPRTWWLQTLATAQNFRGRKLGELTVRIAEAHLVEQQVKDLYLDCVDAAGFLPAFYARLGFVKLEQRNITYPSGNMFPMVLMKKVLRSYPPPSPAA